ncbi:hypothetical protein Tco_0696422, partial [Tanacetum coccineum]
MDCYVAKLLIKTAYVPLLRLPLLPAFPEASNSRERMAHGVNFAAAA